MNKEELQEYRKVAYEIVEHHLKERDKKTKDFIKTTITILTAALALLVGLQGEIHCSEIAMRVSLLSSLVLIGLSVLAGVYCLFGDARSHAKRAAAIKKEAANGRFDTIQNSYLATFPWHFAVAYVSYPYLVFLSILSLCVFGITKYI